MNNPPPVQTQAKTKIRTRTKVLIAGGLLAIVAGVGYFLMSGNARACKLSLCGPTVCVRCNW